MPPIRLHGLLDKGRKPGTATGRPKARRHGPGLPGPHTPEVRAARVRIVVGPARGRTKKLGGRQAVAAARLVGLVPPRCGLHMHCHHVPWSPTEVPQWAYRREQASSMIFCGTLASMRLKVKLPKRRLAEQFRKPFLKPDRLKALLKCVLDHVSPSFRPGRSFRRAKNLCMQACLGPCSAPRCRAVPDVQPGSPRPPPCIRAGR